MRAYWMLNVRVHKRQQETRTLMAKQEKNKMENLRTSMHNFDAISTGLGSAR